MTWGRINREKTPETQSRFSMKQGALLGQNKGREFSGYKWRRCARWWKCVLGVLPMAREEALQGQIQLIMPLYNQDPFFQLCGWRQKPVCGNEWINHACEWWRRCLAPKRYLYSASEFSPQGLVSDSASRILLWSISGLTSTPMRKILIWKTKPL